MNKVRYGVIGLGAIFEMRHRQALEKLPQAEIQAVCDVDEALAAKFAEQYGCAPTTDYMEVMRDDSVDAVMVCTLQGLHLPVAVAAAQAGKHILCEKPLAPDLAGCREIIRAAAAAGVKLCVAENQALDPFIDWVLGLSRDGTLGAIRMIRFAQGWWGPPTARFYQSDKPVRGGALLEDGIHGIAIARRLLDAEPLRVNAVVRTHLPRRQLDMGEVASQVDDTTSMTLEFESAVVSVLLSWTINPGLMSVEVYGTKATICQVNAGWAGLTVHAAAEGGRKLDVPQFEPRFPSQESYLIEDRLFTEAVLTGGEVPYSGESGMRDVEILLATYEASEKGILLDIPPQ